MDLKHETLNTMYEGVNPSMYSEFTAKKLNIPSHQLLENDQVLLAEAESVKLLTIANKNQSADNKSGISAAGRRISTLESLVHVDNITSPLNVNGFLIGGLTRGPVGYSGSGNCVVSAVSAYTKAFQGSYSRSSNAASTQDLATATNPFYYGLYTTGPRTYRGGLAGGMHTPSRYLTTTASGGNWVNSPSQEGCILKLHKPSGGQHGNNNACIVTMKKYCNARKVRFRAYVWIDSGPKDFKIGPFNVQATISVTNLKEWTPVDVVITTIGSTGKYWRIILDTDSAQDVYIGMPGIYALEGTGDTMSTINVED